VESRRRARAFVLGLLAELPRKNCWTIAEQCGNATPDGMQHLLARARWFGLWCRAQVTSLTCTDNPTVTNYCCRIIITKSSPTIGSFVSYTEISGG